MSGFIFVRNVRFRFCTKCLVSLLYEMSCVRIVVPPAAPYNETKKVERFIKNSDCTFTLLITPACECKSGKLEENNSA